METLPLISFASILSTNHFFLISFVFVLGLCAGSFALAMTMRMYARKNWVNDRSQCDHCHKTLQAVDLIPLLSWISTGGKCRYCHKKLDRLYPAVELVTGVLFAISAVFWPYGFTASGIAVFALWLVMATLMVSLVVFDVKWMLLPDKLVYTLVALALSSKLFQVVYYQDLSRLSGLLAGVAVGAGLFAVLYIVSRGQYIGGGDVKFGLFYGVLLSSGFKSMLVICIGSLIGTLLVLPAIVTKKTSMTSQIPFGPSLITATFVMYIFGDRIVELLTTTYLFP